MKIICPYCDGQGEYMRTQQGTKHDSNKLDWSLLPVDSVEEIVKVLHFGAKKYSRDNWKLVDSPEDRYYAAAMRHLIAWKKGKKRDKQSGQSHLAHAGCCLLFLQYFDRVIRISSKQKKSQSKNQ